MNDFISKRLITNSPTPVGAEIIAAPSVPATSVLPFELDQQSLTHIQEGTKEFSAHVGNYKLHYLKYGRYGKDGIKKMKTSPDGW